MSKRKAHFVHVEREFMAHAIPTDEFDALVDEGYDDIVIITPRERYVATVDEWIDYGFFDVDDASGDVFVLSKAYMSRG